MNSHVREGVPIDAPHHHDAPIAVAAPPPGRVAPRLEALHRRQVIFHYIIITISYLAVAATGGGVVWLIVRPPVAEPTYIYRTLAGEVVPDPVHASPAKYTWTHQPEPQFAIPPHAKFLKDVKIVLDPGHVGQDTRNKEPGFKTGPTGLKEKDANLRVTRFLRDFLVNAGADVTLTRERDVTRFKDDDSDLFDRAETANRVRADLFVSIHHNAAANEATNYSLVFYHGEPDESAAACCAGRYVLTGLNEALRLATAAENPLISDTVQYKSGFAVLRHAKVPAILCESSFFTNLAEESRLRDPTYNRREAYGIFLGLARWAQAGLPRVQRIEYVKATRDKDGTVGLRLDDGLSGRGGGGAHLPQILARSIHVRLDGKPIRYAFDADKRRLTITLEKGSAPKALFVDFENVFGQHVLHPSIDLSR